MFRFTDLNESTISETFLSPPPNGYRPIFAYNQSKMCNILFMLELHRRWATYGVFCHAVHPGNVIATSLSQHWWFWRLLFTMVRPFAKSKVFNVSSSYNSPKMLSQIVVLHLKWLANRKTIQQKLMLFIEVAGQQEDNTTKTNAFHWSGWPTGRQYNKN